MFILASKSPRRIEILNNAGYQFKVVKSNNKETIDNNIKGASNAVNIAYGKALDVFKQYPNEVVVAADTIVLLKGEILGKPKNQEDAFKMLKKLNNKKHHVITGVAIIKGNKTKKFYVKSRVFFKDLTDQQLKDYVLTNEPMGKAGSYAIQGVGMKLVKTFKGDYYNIMGLPINKFNKEIKKFLE